MKVYRNISAFKPIENAAVTTGTFDGVHIGHRKILNRLAQVASRVNGQSVLLTFDPHPRMVLQPDADLKLITTLDEKVELLASTGLDHLIIHPFTLDFSRTSSLEFVRNILVNSIGAKKLVIGYDHHFGRNREGSFEHLKEFGPVYGFDVEEISAQDVDQVRISSTKIRNALLNGQVDLAATYLGSPFVVTGFVVKGQQVGNTIGYPTANIELNTTHKLIPADGVYAVRVIHMGQQSQFAGMCNIGMRPTVSGTSKTIEVHLFNFNREIYGERLQLQFVKRIRDEQKFADINALKTQLQNDEARCKEILR